MGLDCIKALWLKKNRKDLMSEYDHRTLQNFEIGNQLHDLARNYYENGIFVDVEAFDIAYGALKTKELIKKHNILYEATAKAENGCFCRADILLKNADAWDIIEIKSATDIKDYYIDDLSFQKYVFENAGYQIKNCKVLHLNNQYVRHGELDIQQMFTSVNVTEMVCERQKNVEMYLQGIFSFLNLPDEPNITIHSKCSDCPFYHYCGKNVPQYSIFDLLSSKTADIFYDQTKSFKVEDVSEEWCTKKQLIDRAAYIHKTLHVEKENIKEWLKTLEYPLYYLDYETVQSAIPMFENSKPYEQIPFQFSLHIQDSPHTKPQHIEFLHQERSDPRRKLAEFLIKSCNKKGSIVVYNKSFEMTRNKELAKLFPDLSDDLLAINNRVVDQLIPFRNRFLYSYEQHSSASIKYVLPAFSNLSYQEMNIANGSEAMGKYLEFLQGKQNEEQSRQMFEDLLKYCEQDTYAMVLLMDVLYQYADDN